MPSQEKRLFPNVIENLVDEINIFTSLMNEPSKIQEKENLKTSFEELEFTVNFFLLLIIILALFQSCL